MVGIQTTYHEGCLSTKFDLIDDYLYTKLIVDSTCWEFCSDGYYANDTIILPDTGRFTRDSPVNSINSGYYWVSNFSHGSPYRWSGSIGAAYIDYVDSGKVTLMFADACETAEFESGSGWFDWLRGDELPERWLSAANKGAVGYIGCGYLEWLPIGFGLLWSSVIGSFTNFLSELVSVVFLVNLDDLSHGTEPQFNLLGDPAYNMKLAPVATYPQLAVYKVFNSAHIDYPEDTLICSSVIVNYGGEDADSFVVRLDLIDGSYWDGSYRVIWSTEKRIRSLKRTSVLRVDFYYTADSDPILPGNWVARAQVDPYNEIDERWDDDTIPYFLEGIPWDTVTYWELLFALGHCGYDSFVAVETTSIPISEGWNLLSLPIDSCGLTLDSIFSFSDDVSILCYSGDGDFFDCSDSTVKPGSGFWVYSDRDTVVKIQEGVVVTDIDSITASWGWDLIGGSWMYF